MENNSFKFTYSAKDMEEVKNIRKKYISQPEDKLLMLKKMDARVHNKALKLSLIIGIIGTLVMGTGMSCCLVLGGTWFVPGIALGVVGIALMCLAYPVYNNALKKEREKAAPEIMRLSDELMK